MGAEKRGFRGHGGVRDEEEKQMVASHHAAVPFYPAFCAGSHDLHGGRELCHK